MNILVAGGAGYIGSHMTKCLRSAGHHPVVFDNLSSGCRAAVLGAEFIEGDLADRSALDHAFSARRFDAVMHFASFIQVGESVRRPAEYYRNNVSNTFNLLDAAMAHGVRYFIFSSSAAIFGEPAYTPIDETHPCAPTNPYGRSKLMVERVLRDYDRAYGLKSVCLRYFNAAGADPEGKLGERHDPETHLIPLLLQAASGRRPSVDIFGRDYDTPDGTCIRDYVHVTDLCGAHLLALDHLLRVGASAAFNIGSGTGFSVQQVVDVVERITGRKLPLRDTKRREGDPGKLVADCGRATEILGWSPRYGDLVTIVKHAWLWEQTMANREAARHGAIL